MTNCLGIIPAAGLGTRWGGYCKELLPTGKDKFIIDCTIDGMKDARINDIIIVSNPLKISTHISHFNRDEYKDLNISFMIQKYQQDIWGAIRTTLPFNRSFNFFGMPDTLYTPRYDSMIHTFNITGCKFIIGTFITNMPERFGVIHNNKIYNKCTEFDTSYTYSAWGTLAWTEDVVDLWIKENPDNYTDAINRIIQKFGFVSAYMDKYIDFANFEDYHSFMIKNN